MSWLRVTGATGEFFNYLVKQNILSHAEARFYIANVLSALQHIHSQSIIYRDLKPENLVFDATGHIKLVDFGFAKVNKRDAKTFTVCSCPANCIESNVCRVCCQICGTVEYMAPEVIAGKGYGRTIDLWSVGILLYEMLAGCTPYNAEGGVVGIYAQIINGRLSFPSTIEPTSNVASFIGSLLFINPSKRLGCTENGFQDIREHAWFTQGEQSWLPEAGPFNWAALEASELTPPFVPKCEKLPERKIGYCDLKKVLRFKVCPNWNPKLDLLS